MEKQEHDDGSWPVWDELDDDCGCRNPDLCPDCCDPTEMVQPQEAYNDGVHRP